MERKTWFPALSGASVLYVTAGICALFGVLFFLLVHLPLREATYYARTDAEEAKAEYIRVANFRNAHLDMASYEKTLSDHEAQGEKALPSELEEGAFLRTLHRAAIESNITLRQVTPKEIKTEDGIRALPVEVAFHCDYFTLLDFLQSLQGTDRFICVKEMKLSKKDSGLDCEVQLVIYAMEGDAPQEDEGDTGLIYPHE